MQTYMLFLRSEPNEFAELSPEEIQGIFLRIKNWREGLAARGHVPTGQKLRDLCGRQLRQSEGKIVVTDGPYAETREILGGYFAFDADSFDQAVELSRDCPLLPFGSIEIREVEQR
jgi:hypothetical protein